MAVYTHGVTERDVLNTLPAATGSISETSTGLNLGQVRAFIERAAGQVNNQLARHGVPVEQLGENPTQLARDAIIAYAGAMSYEALGGSEEKIDRRMREWASLLKMLREEPQALGEAQDGDEQSGSKSNLDTRRPTKKRFNSSGYKY